ncbi:5'-Nucleotidase domain protein, partial [hydrothermal vent metagenome]
PDGNRNAETIMIDPLTLDIYIVSKESVTKVYRTACPYTFHAAPTFDVDTLEVVTSFTFDTAVGGDISPDGKEILIKRYHLIYYWSRDEGQTIDEALEADIRTVPYVIEPQGEAVCWASDLSGYYTLSEGSHPHLYLYPRLYPTDVLIEESNPDVFSLGQNYPNPFNPSTTIKYSIPAVGNENFRSVQLKVYDILGKEVATLVNKEQQAGNYEVHFNASDLPSGMYLYKIQAGEFSAVQKMMLLK